MTWPLIAIAVFLILAATLSWSAASRRGRDPWRWAVATVLLGGLPLLWQIIDSLFGDPVRKDTVEYDCCGNQEWTPVADLGHAASVDFDLGRCANCGAYVMALFYVSSTTYVVVSKEEAERFLALQGTPELRKALKDWFD